MTPANFDDGGNKPADATATPATFPADGPPEKIDVATALLQHLHATGASTGVAPAGEDALHSPDDLLPVALHDAIAHSIDHALDQLTTSPDLFDLPALDFGGDGGNGES